MGAKLASFAIAVVLVAGAVPALAVVETAAAEEVVETAAAEEVDTALPSGSVARAAFTTGIVDREPQDSLEMLSNDHVQVYFFTELRDMQGQTVIHRWMWNGQVMGEVAFDVGGPRWRVNSSKNLEPSWLGEWTVLVVDTAGNEIGGSHRFSYSATEVSEPVEPSSDAPAKLEME